MTRVVTPSFISQARTRMSTIGGSGLSAPFHTWHCPCTPRTWMSALQSVGGWFFGGCGGFLRFLKTAHRAMFNVGDFLWTLCVRKSLRLICMSWPSVTSILTKFLIEFILEAVLHQQSMFSVIVFTLLHGRGLMMWCPNLTERGLRECLRTSSRLISQ